MKFFGLALAALVLPLSAFAGHLQGRQHHQDVARRADGHVALHRRFDNSKWSWYDAQTGNAGSCGRFIKNTDFAVAMNVPQYQAGNCFKPITMSYNGKTTTAIIMDMCPGCPYGGLDLTPSLFAFFAPHSVGLLWTGSWTFGAGAAPPPAAPPAAPPAPKPTRTKPKWTPPPTPSRPPRTTTRTTSRTSTRTTSTTSSPTTTSSTQEDEPSPISTSSSSKQAAATPTPTSSSAKQAAATPTPGNLDDFNQLLVQLGDIVVVGANSA